MRISQKVAMSAFAVTVVAGLSACTHSTYDTRAAYGCTGPNAAETCRYPTYAGSVIIDGKPYQYLHYRDGNGAREYWLNGVWRKADIG